MPSSLKKPRKYLRLPRYPTSPNMVDSEIEAHFGENKRRKAGVRFFVMPRGEIMLCRIDIRVKKSGIRVVYKSENGKTSHLYSATYITKDDGKYLQSWVYAQKHLLIRLLLGELDEPIQLARLFAGYIISRKNKK